LCGDLRRCRSAVWSRGGVLLSCGGASGRLGSGGRHGGTGSRSDARRNSGCGASRARDSRITNNSAYGSSRARSRRSVHEAYQFVQVGEALHLAAQ
jgi:hypothetical protein